MTKKYAWIFPVLGIGALILLGVTAEDGNRADSPVDTSNWKKYQNEEFGFEIKIPADWRVEKTIKGNLLFTSTNGEKGAKAIEEECIRTRPVNTDANICANPYSANLSFSISNPETRLLDRSNEKTVSLAGYNWQNFHINGSPYFELTLEEKVYLFSGGDENEIKNILQTFRITPSSASNEKELSERAFQAINQKTFGEWDKEFEITRVHESKNAVEGKWVAKDTWPWIGWRENGTWKVIVSIDGFDCDEVEAIPKEYDDFFREILPESSPGYKSCYVHKIPSTLD